ELVRDVQTEAEARELCFLATDVDQDGGKIVLTAGVPRSSGNDDERLLLALRGIVAKTRAFEVQVGVNTGAVFAGDIGPAFRRTYTVMGDAVNFAARLMAVAPAGQILATRETVSRSRSKFVVHVLDHFLVKGKSI